MLLKIFTEYPHWEYGLDKSDFNFGLFFLF